MMLDLDEKLGLDKELDLAHKQKIVALVWVKVQIGELANGSVNLKTLT